MSLFDPLPLPPEIVGGEPAPLGILLISGTYERAHYALVLATAAAATARPVVLFATNAGVRAFLAARPDGAPGWTSLAHYGGAAKRDEELVGRGVAGFGELLSSAKELGVRLIVCEAGMKAEAITPEMLDDTLEGEVAGAVTFLAETEGGQIITL
jgi:peroxiredoxin family protein